MGADRNGPLRVGYVLKRFPRASETFIAQELLELERQGVAVQVFALRANDCPAPHAWLRSLRAPVTCFESRSFSTAWHALKARGQRPGDRRQGARRALLMAFDHPTRSGRRYLAEAVAVARWVERAGIHHLHAHFANHPAFVALLAHLIAGVPFSFTAHAKDVYAEAPSPELWRRQLRHAAFAVTVAEATRSHLWEVVGHGGAAKLRRLYNGVDLRWIRPAPPRPPAPVPRLVCVARLIEKKGIDVLLEALGRLQRRAAFSCAIVGDGPEAAPLRRRAAVLGLDGRVEFVGALPHEGVVRRLQAADLFVLPCRVAPDGDRDALPTVLLEAMAAAVPCVSTRVGGIAEIVAHGETGLLVPPEQPAALEQALLSLLLAPERRRRLGEAGRQRAERLFDLRRNVAVLHRWFAEAAGAGSPPASSRLPASAAAGPG